MLYERVRPRNNKELNTGERNHMGRGFCPPLFLNYGGQPTDQADSGIMPASIPRGWDRVVSRNGTVLYKALRSTYGGSKVCAHMLCDHVSSCSTHTC